MTNQTDEMTTTETQRTETKTDIFNKITQNIIDDLEKGELTWRKPWNADHLAGHVGRPLRWNDIPYTGINILVLWAAVAEQGFSSPYWMTFRQASALKAHVRSGEKAVHVVYTDKVMKEVEENGEKQNKEMSFLKIYPVFNAQQIEGLPEHYYKAIEPKTHNPDERLQGIEEFIKQTKADIKVGAEAVYRPKKDVIEIPPFESFDDGVSYYATLSHEITHWTKHKSRLNRDFNQKRFGDHGYAIEELVAELGACFLGADLGFEPILKGDHAAYIQSWLKVLKGDKKFIFQAASHAQKAVDYLGKLQR
jgi:antirestriction protein ArdC